MVYPEPSSGLLPHQASTILPSGRFWFQWLWLFVATRQHPDQLNRQKHRSQRHPEPADFAQQYLGAVATEKPKPNGRDGDRMPRKAKARVIERPEESDAAAAIRARVKDPVRRSDHEKKAREI